MVSKAAMIQILGSPVAYYVTFAKVAGDVCAGVFISQFFYWYGRGHDPDQWIYKTQAEIEEETGLSRRNQETARKNLKALGILEEKLEGLPARLHYRLDIEALFALVDKPVCANPPNCDGGTVQTGKAEPAKHSIYTETTTETTTESATHRTPSDPYFEAVCWMLGRNTKTMTKKGRMEVGKIVKKFKAENYTLDDLRSWWKNVWLKDWRSKRGAGKPTAKQLTDEFVLNTSKDITHVIPDSREHDTLPEYDPSIFDTSNLNW